MCGIVGYITNSRTANLDRKKFIEQALVIDTLRGDDSTGLFCVNHDQDKDYRDGACAYGKVVTDGYHFTQSKTFKDTFGTDTSLWRAAIGHNRAATLGGVNIDTAHPFNVGPITLVHNGTLGDMTHMRYSDYDSESFNDSHAVARNLAEDDVELVISQLDGAFALVWHDARDDKIRIVRNADRPLHMTVAKTGASSTLYMASEAGMLAWLMRRLRINHGAIFEPKPGWLLEFDRDPAKPESKEVPLYVAPKRPVGYGNWYNGGSGKAIGTPKTESGTTNTNHTALGSASNTVSVLGGKREVPELLQEWLLDEGLLVENRISFAPRSSQKTNWGPSFKRRMVAGQLVDVNSKYHKIAAVVHGVPESVAENHMGHFWTVRPVGVKVGFEGQTIVVCKLVSFTKARCGDTVDVEYWDAIERQREEDEDSAAVLGNTYVDDVEKWLEGPYGSYVTPADWLIATQSGCGWCAKALVLSDADHVRWVNGGEMPVCDDCWDDIGHCMGNLH